MNNTVAIGLLKCFTKAGCNAVLFIVGVMHQIDIIAAQIFVSFLSV